MKLASRMSALPLVALFLLAMTLNADTLVLRDGRRLQGQLISVRDGVIEFQESRSRGVRIDRDDVTSIEFGRSERNQPDYPQTQSGRPRGLRERQLMVVANVQWTDTNIACKFEPGTISSRAAWSTDRGRV